jgi:hypothetical protein
VGQRARGDLGGERLRGDCGGLLRRVSHGDPAAIGGPGLAVRGPGRRRRGWLWWESQRHGI